MPKAAVLIGNDVQLTWHEGSQFGRVLVANSAVLPKTFTGRKELQGKHPLFAVQPASCILNQSFSCTGSHRQYLPYVHSLLHLTFEPSALWCLSGLVIDLPKVHFSIYKSSLFKPSQRQTDMSSRYNWCVCRSLTLQHQLELEFNGRLKSSNWTKTNETGHLHRNPSCLALHSLIAMLSNAVARFTVETDALA